MSAKIDSVHIMSILSAIAGGAQIEIVFNLQSLRSMVMARPYEYRLISFCNGIIIPKDILSKLCGPGYNFHPGSPDYPGKYPSYFAFYDRAPVFGATVHEMEEAVDSGPIVAVSSFNSSSTSSQELLAFGAHLHAVRLLQSLAARLIAPAPLERLPCRWGRRHCSQKAAEEICTVSAGIGAEELGRLISIFGSIVPIRTVIADRSFVLAPQAPALANS